MKKLLYFLIFAILVAGVYTRYFFYFDVPQNCYISISPSFLEFSNRSVINAINVLKQASYNDYEDLCTNVTKINPNISCGGFEGGCFYNRRPKTIDISTSERSLAWTASVIVHETCHVMQFQESRAMSENECDQKMVNTLVNIVEY